jgi:NTE family protein
MKRKRDMLGLALGGGGARGLAHMGVVRALEEGGITADLVAGTSMGAIVGALYAAGYSSARMELLALEMDLRAFFPLTDVRLFSGAVKGESVEAWLRRHLPTSFDDLQMPFACVSVDLTSGQRVVHDRGDLPNAVRASISLPLVFAPVCEDGTVLVDGGLVEPVPVRLAREMGADLVVAVAVGSVSHGLVPEKDHHRPVLARRRGTRARVEHRRVQPPGILDVAMASLDVLRHQVGLEEMKEADLLITPDVGGYGIGELSQAASIMERGYAAGIQAVPAINEMIKAKPWYARTARPRAKKRSAKPPEATRDA